MYQKFKFLQNSFQNEYYSGIFGLTQGVFFTLFYKQPVYKQLVLGWKIAKQLSGLRLSNNKKYRLKKSGVLPL